MFAGKNIGLSVLQGWCQTFEALCQDIDAELGDDKRGFHWVQCKEKLGMARWHWDMGPDQDRPDVITKRVNNAVAKTKHLCGVCGEPGEIDLEADWMLTLCPAHTQENRHQEKMDRLSRIKAPKGVGELVLYLGFDGVLHHGVVAWISKKASFGLDARVYAVAVAARMEFGRASAIMRFKTATPMAASHRLHPVGANAVGLQ
ncbi:hypothetical protein BLL52_2897 [Rhodoferax antarcticus ANT.BR]|uniref:Uncharacterized protein n=1 Tax=Rhodoferax antarcticus ANT.BR TaxID=1111071 RepID=A0A1Q8YF27_9BURK|nr:hypothetical protein BLL52_2897 [Rhodoferax antarcticus ANT.BR]